MSRCWRGRSSPSSVDRDAWISTRHPVAYADRVRITRGCARGGSEGGGNGSSSSSPRSVLVDGDAMSVDRRLGFGGKSVPYPSIRAGRWEDYDPWDSAARLRGLQDDEDDETDDEDDDDDKHESRNSVLRMFNGVLALSIDPSTPPSLGPTCALPLRLTTAYQLLRPLFTPRRPLPTPGIGKPNVETIARFLDPSNWTLQVASTTMAAAAARQELNEALRPMSNHLPPQPLATGDYMIWHPDAIMYSPCSTSTTITTTTPSSKTLLLPLPASPLTRAGAVFLARQRRAFLLGFPGPDYARRGAGGAQIDVGESCHLGRPGVQEIYEAGGEEGLRAMGLLAWEEGGGREEEGLEHEGDLVQMANGILFPERAQWRKGR